MHIVAGSLINQVMTQSRQPDPIAGMGATICMFTDRHAATIVKVTSTQVHVQEDAAKRIDTNGMCDSGQEYEYTPQPKALVQVFRRNKRGVYRNASGNTLSIGHRSKFYDFSF